MNTSDLSLPNHGPFQFRINNADRYDTLLLAKAFQAAAYKASTGQNLSEVLGEDKIQVHKPETIDTDYTEESPKLIE